MNTECDIQGAFSFRHDRSICLDFDGSRISSFRDSEFEALNQVMFISPANKMTTTYPDSVEIRK